MREKLEKVLAQWLKDEGIEEKELWDANNVAQFLDYLNYGVKDLPLMVGFDGVVNMANPSEGYGMTAQYSSSTLGKTIILTCDDGFSFDSSKELVDTIMRWNDEAEALEAKLKSVWKK